MEKPKTKGAHLNKRSDLNLSKPGKPGSMESMMEGMSGKNGMPTIPNISQIMPMVAAMSGENGKSPFMSFPAMQQSMGNKNVQKIITPKSDSSQNVNSAQRADAYKVTRPAEYQQLMKNPDMAQKLTGSNGAKVQRKPANGSAEKLNPLASQSIQQKTQSGGQRLPTSMQKKLRKNMGVANPGSIKVHTDDKADKLSRGLGARAFTTSNHIFFKKGEYAPNTSKGERLIFHESWHTVQQAKPSGVSTNGGKTVRPANDKYEKEADVHAGRAMARSQAGNLNTVSPYRFTNNSSPSMIQRKDDDDEKSEEEKKEEERESKEKGKEKTDKKKDEGDKNKGDSKESAKKKGDKKPKQKPKSKIPGKKGGPMTGFGPKLDPGVVDDIDTETGTEMKFDPEEFEFEEPEIEEGIPTWDELADGTVQMSIEDVQKEYKTRQAYSEEDGDDFSSVSSTGEIDVDVPTAEPDKGAMLASAFGDGALAGFQEGAEGWATDTALELATAKIPYADGAISLVKLLANPEQWWEDNVMAIGDGAVNMAAGFSAIGDESTGWGYIAATLEAVIGLLDFILQITGLINQILSIILFIMKAMLILSNIMIGLAPLVIVIGFVPIFPFVWTPAVFGPVASFTSLVISWLDPVNNLVSAVANVLLAVKLSLLPLAIMFRMFDILAFEGDPEELEAKQAKLQGSVQTFTQMATEKALEKGKDKAGSSIKKRRDKAEIKNMEKMKADPKHAKDPDLDAKIAAKQADYQESYGKKYLSKEDKINRADTKEKIKKLDTDSKVGDDAKQKAKDDYREKFGRDYDTGSKRKKAWQMGRTAILPAAAIRNLKAEGQSFSKNRAERHAELTGTTRKKLDKVDKQADPKNLKASYEDRAVNLRGKPKRTEAQYDASTSKRKKKLASGDDESLGTRLDRKSKEIQKKTQARRDVDAARQKTLDKAQKKERDSNIKANQKQEAKLKQKIVEAKTKSETEKLNKKLGTLEAKMETRYGEGERQKRKKAAEKDVSDFEAQKKADTKEGKDLLDSASDNDIKAKSLDTAAKKKDKAAKVKEDEAADFRNQADKIEKKAIKQDKAEIKARQDAKLADTRAAGADIQLSSTKSDLRKSESELTTIQAKKASAEKKFEKAEADYDARIAKAKEGKLEGEVAELQKRKQAAADENTRKNHEFEDQNNQKKQEIKELETKRDKQDKQVKDSIQEAKDFKVAEQKAKKTADDLRETKKKPVDLEKQAKKTEKEAKDLRGKAIRERMKAKLQRGDAKDSRDKAKKLDERTPKELDDLEREKGVAKYLDPDDPEHVDTTRYDEEVKQKKWKVYDKWSKYTDKGSFGGQRHGGGILGTNLVYDLLRGKTPFQKSADPDLGPDHENYAIILAKYTEALGYISSTQYLSASNILKGVDIPEEVDKGTFLGQSLGTEDKNVNGFRWSYWESKAKVLEDEVAKRKKDQTRWGKKQHQDPNDKDELDPEYEAFTNKMEGYQNEYEALSKNLKDILKNLFIMVDIYTLGVPESWTKFTPAATTFTKKVTYGSEESNINNVTLTDFPTGDTALSHGEIINTEHRAFKEAPEVVVTAKDVVLTDDDEKMSYVPKYEKMTVGTSNDHYRQLRVFVGYEPSWIFANEPATTGMEEVAYLYDLTLGGEVPPAANDFTITADTKPTWLTLSGDYTQISGTPPPSTAGKHPVKLTAMKNDGSLVLVKEFDIIVEAAPVKKSADEGDSGGISTKRFDGPVSHASNGMELQREEEEEGDEVEEVVSDDEIAHQKNVEARAKLMGALPAPPENMHERISGSALAYNQLDAEEYDLKLQQQQIGGLVQHGQGQIVELEGLQQFGAANKKAVEGQIGAAEMKSGKQDELSGGLSNQQGKAKETSDKSKGGDDVMGGIFSKITSAFGIGSSQGAGDDGGASSGAGGAKSGISDNKNTTKATADATKSGVSDAAKDKGRIESVKGQATKAKDDIENYDSQMQDEKDKNIEGIGELEDSAAQNEETIAATMDEKGRLRDDHLAATEEAEIWAMEHKSIREEMFAQLEEDLAA